MQRVLVSGGAGLVGRYIVERLAAAGYRVRVGGRNAPTPGLFAPAVEFAPLDLDPEADNSAAFAGVDHFVHAAFFHLPGKYRGGEGDDPATFRRLNLDGTIRLFEAARDAGVQRTVFLSSRAVYDGLPAAKPLSEDAELSPSSLYGTIKLAAERRLAALSGGSFCGTSLRATGVYGDLRPNKWEKLAGDYLAGLPVAVRAGTEVHGRDLAQAVRILLEAAPDLVAGRSFNLSDIIVDTRDILAPVKAVTSSPHPLPAAADRSEIREMPTGRIRALGWQPGGIELFRKTVEGLAASFRGDPEPER